MAEFFELVKQASIVGRLSGLRIVPLNCLTVAASSGSTLAWTGPGKMTPVGKLQLGSATLAGLKASGIIAQTEELARSKDPAAERLFTADFVRGAAELLDGTFIDPDNLGIVDVMPASILNGVTPIPATGDASVDIPALIAGFHGDLGGAYLISDPVTFTQMALTHDAGAGYPFLDLGPRGGSALGLPCVASRSCPRTSDGHGIIALVDPAGIAFGSNDIRIDASRQASLQMDSAPTDPPTAATVMISLFQENLIGLRCELFCNWRVERSGSVAYLSGVSY